MWKLVCTLQLINIASKTPRVTKSFKLLKCYLTLVLHGAKKPAEGKSE